MRSVGGDPWSMRITQTDADFYYPLWLRDALRLDVGRDPIIPGRLTVRPPNRSALVPEAGPQLVAGWRAWWSDLALAAPAWASATRYMDRAAAPHFDGLSDWPDLQRLTRQLWTEADQWFNEYKRAVLLGFVDRLDRTSLAAREAAERLGHPLGDLQLDLIVLPVEGSCPLEVTRRRYIVPESVYEHPDWYEFLVGMFIRAF